MYLIEEYILEPKSTRQTHLNLEEDCIDRINGHSFYLKGLLAHILNTTIPKGNKILLCHACHNGKCCNPNHLYWGTPSENINDAFDNGALNIWERMVEKYGIEEAKRMQARGDKKSGGLSNKGKPKSEEHKRKISESLKGKTRGKYNKRSIS